MSPVQTVIASWWARWRLRSDPGAMADAPGAPEPGEDAAALAQTTWMGRMRVLEEEMWKTFHCMQRRMAAPGIALKDYLHYWKYLTNTTTRLRLNVLPVIGDQQGADILIDGLHEVLETRFGLAVTEHVLTDVMSHWREKLRALTVAAAEKIPPGEYVAPVPAAA